ncbi:diguanylate cyclase [Teredinibacter sp. KSP-S5-2]|uniref:sensor domain-containing diguanylate cyclase n=1 Tax=Teredinibacter sp. KSP-S5-2 TaxID=3034506 RepID=UPI00293521BA|nr:diguanylate cyclase [Teredinibacter sp. KSP-S5-2]WNO08711.1 diguanylate cyclase [Teredinibacter sp. KSP-S5-2]
MNLAISLNRAVSVKVVGLILVLLSLVVCWSWVTNADFLLGSRNDFPTMKFNAALCFLFLGIAMIANERQQTLICYLFASLVAFFSSEALFAQHLLGINSGLNELFVYDLRSPKMPGLMSPAEACCFLLSSFLLLEQYVKNMPMRGHFYLMYFVIGFISLSAYCLYVYMPFGADIIPFVTSTPLCSSLAFLFLIPGLILSTNNTKLATLLSGHKHVHKTFRRIAFYVAMLPIFLGILVYSREWYRTFESNLVFALFTSLSIISILLLLYRVTLAEVRWQIRWSSQKAIADQLETQVLEVLEASDNAILLLDDKLTIIHVNRGARTIFGWEARDLLQQPFHGLIAETSKYKLNSLIEVIDQYQSNKKICNVEDILTIRKKNGKATSVAISINKKTQTDKHFFVMVLRDLSVIEQENKTLRAQVSTDPLTRTFNRSEFEKFTHRLDKQDEQNGTSNYTIMMLDIDHFKAVNDTYGHDAGDIVLRDFTESVQSCLRSSDKLFRYGGEEFVAIMPGLDKKSASNVAERILLTVKTKNTLLDNLLIGITVSIGVYMAKLPQESITESVRKADKALYSAKEQGRDRAIFFSDN